MSKIRNIIGILLGAGVMLGMISCDNNYETIFSESPDQRAEAAMDEYNTLLTEAPFGWKASLYTSTGAGYFYYLDFKDDGNVTMLSDFDATAAGEPMESTWALKALQRTTLSFTTYSYIHLPADPDHNINNGLPGSGLLSDFEFAIISTSADSVILKGTQHNSEIILIRSTEQETQAFYNKRIQFLLLQTEQFLASSKGYRLTLPDQSVVPMALSIDYKLISFQFLDTDGNTIRIPKTSYTFSIDGIVLKEPLKVKNFEISKLIWDDNTNSYVVPFDDPATLTGTDEPYVFNPSTPLYSLLGHELTTAIVPYGAGADPLPGQSDTFTEAYNYAAEQMLAGPYRLTLEEIRFVFVPNTDRMLMILSVLQPVPGGGASRFNAQYTYSYQVRDGGIVKFRLEGTDGNAGALYTDMIGILSHFDNDTFKLEYIGGGFNLIAGFFSQEEPDYHFSGYLLE
jgi:hypothetical protein